MKKHLYLLLLAGFLATASSCSKDSTSPSSSTGTKNCGTYTGKQLYLGPQGGCYYINSSGNNEYVVRSFCNC